LGQKLTIFLNDDLSKQVAVMKMVQWRCEGIAQSQYGVSITTSPHQLLHQRIAASPEVGLESLLFPRYNNNAHGTQQEGLYP